MDDDKKEKYKIENYLRNIALLYNNTFPINLTENTTFTTIVIK